MASRYVAAELRRTSHSVMVRTFAADFRTSAEATRQPMWWTFTGRSETSNPRLLQHSHPAFASRETVPMRSQGLISISRTGAKAPRPSATHFVGAGGRETNRSATGRIVTSTFWTTVTESSAANSQRIRCGREDEVVPDVWIEQTTYRLQGGCSTTELIRQLSVSNGNRVAGERSSAKCPLQPAARPAKLNRCGWPIIACGTIESPAPQPMQCYLTICRCDLRPLVPFGAGLPGVGGVFGGVVVALGSRSPCSAGAAAPAA